MNKKELVAKIAGKTGQTQKSVNATLDSFFEFVGAALGTGESVRLSGFGTFETKTRAARTGKNPHTGEELEIPAMVVPVFKAGKKLKGKTSKI